MQGFSAALHVWRVGLRVAALTFCSSLVCSSSEQATAACCKPSGLHLHSGFSLCKRSIRISNGVPQASSRVWAPENVCSPQCQHAKLNLLLKQFKPKSSGAHTIYSLAHLAQQQPQPASVADSECFCEGLSASLVRPAFRDTAGAGPRTAWGALWHCTRWVLDCVHTSSFFCKLENAKYARKCTQSPFLSCRPVSSRRLLQHCLQSQLHVRRPVCNLDAYL